MGGSVSSPETSQESVYLVAGTYYIRASKYHSNTGKYQFQAIFTSANETEVEPNETPETANAITLGAWNVGIISETDPSDYFKINISSAGKVFINIRTHFHYANYDIIDTDGYVVLKEYNPMGGSESSPTASYEEITLNPGTYYIRVRKFSSYTGKYEFQITMTNTPEITSAPPVTNTNSPSPTVTTKPSNPPDETIITNAKKPTIIAQPKGKTVKKKKQLTLKISAMVNKGRLSFQWYRNNRKSNKGGRKISKATKKTYKVPTKKKGIKYYFCIVTNTDNSATGNNKATTSSKAIKVKVK